MVSEVVSFTLDSMIKGYHIYKDVSFKCYTIAVMKEVEKGPSDRHTAASKLVEMYILWSTCKET